MTTKSEVRIDKWLWAVRIYKTRSIASDACKSGKVKCANQQLKPARTVKVGSIIDVRKGPVTFSFKVLALAENRMNAKLVPEFMENVTTPAQWEILELHKLSYQVNRDRGTGRPTKKDRREIVDYKENDLVFMDEDWDFLEENEQ